MYRVLSDGPAEYGCRIALLTVWTEYVCLTSAVGKCCVDTTTQHLAMRLCLLVYTPLAHWYVFAGGDPNLVGRHSTQTLSGALRAICEVSTSFVALALTGDTNVKDAAAAAIHGSMVPRLWDIAAHIQRRDGCTHPAAGRQHGWLSATDDARHPADRVVDFAVTRELL
jgi:hypothetical protein